MAYDAFEIADGYRNSVTGMRYFFIMGSMSVYTVLWPSSTTMTTERGGGWRSFPEVEIYQLPEGDNCIAIVPEIFQVGFKDRCSYCHAVGNNRAEAVIE